MKFSTFAVASAAIAAGVEGFTASRSTFGVRQVSVFFLSSGWVGWGGVGGERACGAEKGSLSGGEREDGSMFSRCSG